jgi:hypothetical protein
MRLLPTTTLTAALTLLATLAVPVGACAAEPKPAVDLALARQYFEEARALWQKDGGRLWGVSLEGPLLFADRQTRQVVASQADKEDRLRPGGNVFVGQLPENVGVANTSTKWAGVQWIMVIWPLPEDKSERAALLMHESWHRVQDRLGLPPAGPSNQHLDTLEGRIWLQLEWRALAAALAAEGKARSAAVEDTLLFRARRRALFKDAANDERSLEMHEGLAEYTGVKLSADTAAAVAYVVKELARRPQAMPTFVRSFAYLSGPSYGLLLDATSENWRKGLKPEDDLGSKLQAALALTLPDLDDAGLAERAKRYQGVELRAAETRREEERKKRVAEYQALLVEGPVLVLPLGKDVQISFNPNALHPLEGSGTVYIGARLSDSWGTVTTTKALLINKTFTRATVPAPANPLARPLKGEGWQIDLKDGWKLKPGERKGDFQLVNDKE